jgi:hypothetical protein
LQLHLFVDIRAKFCQGLSRVFIMVTLTAPALLNAQNEPVQVGSVRGVSVRKHPLTASQATAVRLLNSVQVEANTLDPIMKGLVLFEVAQAFDRLNPRRADALLREAFNVTSDMNHEDSFECMMSDPCRSRQWVERGILKNLVRRSPALAEKLLSSADTLVRPVIAQLLIAEYTGRKNFKHAEELVNRATANAGFPYRAANDLMRALPNQRSGEKLTIFTQAVQNFREFGGNSIPESEDLATMVLSFWHDLPEAAVLDAIDALLEQAKGAEQSGKLQITLKSKKDSADFSSAYRYRVFQLLPVLKELDNPRAADLLHESHEDQMLLRQFPGGYESLTPEDRESTTAKGQSTNNWTLDYEPTSSSPESIGYQLQAQRTQQLARIRDSIVQETAKDPQQALTDALDLPTVVSFLSRVEFPRAEALLGLAQITARDSPVVSRRALEELWKITDYLPLLQQARFLIDAAEVYLQIGDPESAHQSIRECLDVAQVLYARDNNASDPNQVIKAKWPSANVWWRLIGLAARISPDLASQILSAIPDVEIAALEKAGFAKALLGSSSDVPMWAEELHNDGVNQIANF